MRQYSAYLILGCFLVFVLFWAISAFFTKRTVQKVSRGWGFWIFPAGAILLILLRRLGVSFLQHAALWPETFSTFLLADIVAILGLFTTLWARVTLGGNWSANVTVKENHELIERGPYAFVRHPIYTGILMLILSLAIFYGSLVSILVFVFGFIGYGLKAMKEEHLMIEHFGDAYVDYKGRTKALIPFIL